MLIFAEMRHTSPSLLLKCKTKSIGPILEMNDEGCMAVSPSLANDITESFVQN